MSMWCPYCKKSAGDAFGYPTSNCYHSILVYDRKPKPERYDPSLSPDVTCGDCCHALWILFFIWLFISTPLPIFVLIALSIAYCKF